MNILSGILISIAQVFILWYLAEHMLGATERSQKVVLAGYILIGIADYAMFVFDLRYWLKTCIMLVISLIIALYIYTARLWNVILTVALYYIVLYAISEGSMLLLNLCGAQTDRLMRQDFGYLMYYSFVLLSLMFLVQLFLVLSGNLFRQNYLVQTLPQLLILIICIVVCVINIIMTDWRVWMLEQALVNLLMLAIGIVICAYIEIIKEYFEGREQILFAEQQLSMQKEYYKNVLDYQDETRRLWHDIGKYTAAVNTLVEGNSSKDAEIARAEMDERIKNISAVTDVNNQVINSILTYALRKCRDIGARLDVKAWVSEELNIPATDLFVIIGNTVDNSIEACADLDQKDRIININLIQKNHVLVYEIINKMPLSETPKKGNIHGYGLKNVESCVKKHGGSMAINRDGGQFAIIIHLNV